MDITDRPGIGFTINMIKIPATDASPAKVQLHFFHNSSDPLLGQMLPKDAAAAYTAYRDVLKGDNYLLDDSPVPAPDAREFDIMVGTIPGAPVRLMMDILGQDLDDYQKRLGAFMPGMALQRRAP